MDAIGQRRKLVVAKSMQKLSPLVPYALKPQDLEKNSQSHRISTRPTHVMCKQPRRTLNYSLVAKHLITHSNNRALGSAFVKLLIIFLSLNLNIARAQTVPEPGHPPKEVLAQATTNTSELIKLITSTAQESTEKSIRDISKLELEIRVQTEKIKHLEKEVISLKKPEDTSSATLVLAAVSVIITVLGVLIAILSILGYSNIKKEAKKDARTTAKATVELITKIELPAATERNIIKLIEENRFDKLIQNAVENVVYRGIYMPDDIADEERER
ncbi:hypothetical protein T3A99_19270 [Pseudomonas sp. N-137]|uniref:hypothetical protein n=1 Tax=Pseudomonas sp. N-137 TaxID=3108452 RepID=UPI002ADED386|nr:hypothetical protein [Pseudomonas sp. N-137]MEA1030709.1 hypothetical protein [Pseudomonas sp. N-137]